MSFWDKLFGSTKPSPALTPRNPIQSSKPDATAPTLPCSDSVRQKLDLLLAQLKRLEEPKFDGQATKEYYKHKACEAFAHMLSLVPETQMNPAKLLEVKRQFDDYTRDKYGEGLDFDHPWTERARILRDIYNLVFPAVVAATQKPNDLDSTMEAAGYEKTMTRPSDENAVEDTVVQAMLARQSCLEEHLFETGEKNPRRILCSDNDCPCTDQKPLIIGRTAYLYISQGVVDFRKTCVTLLEREIELQQAAKKLGSETLLIDGGVANPFYLCEIGAKRRGLDLSVALADAKRVAETGFAPLRPTTRSLT